MIGYDINSVRQKNVTDKNLCDGIIMDMAWFVCWQLALNCSPGISELIVFTCCFVLYVCNLLSLLQCLEIFCFQAWVWSPKYIYFHEVDFWSFQPLINCLLMLNSSSILVSFCMSRLLTYTHENFPCWPHKIYSCCCR